MANSLPPQLVSRVALPGATAPRGQAGFSLHSGGFFPSDLSHGKMDPGKLGSTKSSAAP